VRDIRKVAVLGAGTMGSRIAAHLANASIPSVLLDIVPKDLSPQEKAKGLTLSDPSVRSRLAQNGMDAALKSRPAAFFVPEAARMIAIGNFEDHLSSIKDCDWIIEAVTEDLKIKRALFEKLQALRAPGTIVSSNTSGISIASIAAGFSDDFRQHFLGTHFFNPPRYMKLLEIIPTPDTRPEVVESVSRFGDVVLGKGIVIAKDRPNFIANRIGTFVTLNVLRIMQQDGYSIEEIDALTGPAMGLPKSATFRTLDIVGLDVLATWPKIWPNRYRMTSGETSCGFPISLSRCSSAICWAKRLSRAFTKKLRAGRLAATRAKSSRSTSRRSGTASDKGRNFRRWKWPGTSRAPASAWRR
jgi:3-hydroxyacyl-CoA dehydrogenase